MHGRLHAADQGHKGRVDESNEEVEGEGNREVLRVGEGEEGVMRLVRIRVRSRQKLKGPRLVLASSMRALPLGVVEWR